MDNSTKDNSSKDSLPQLLQRYSLLTLTLTDPHLLPSTSLAKAKTNTQTQTMREAVALPADEIERVERIEVTLSLSLFSLLSSLHVSSG